MHACDIRLSLRPLPGPEADAPICSVVSGIMIGNRCQESALTDVAMRVMVHPEGRVVGRHSVAIIAPGGRHTVLGSTLAFEDTRVRVGTELRVEVAVEGEVVRSVVVSVVDRNSAQWAGFELTPDGIADLVSPESPAVASVLDRALGVLERSGRVARFDGYDQGTGRRAWEQSSAIWATLASFGFEKIHGVTTFLTPQAADQTLAEGRGSSLDLALLLAACLEKAGLGPVIGSTRDHPFVAVWLEEGRFGDHVIDAAAELRERIRGKEMVVFDPGLLFHSPPAGSRAAFEAGLDLLAVDRDDAFQAAVDILQARSSGIASSIAERASGADRLPPADPVPDTDFGFFDAEEEPEADGAAAEDRSRLERWRSRLLDLTLRNRLLNFKAGRKAVSIVCPQPGLLEDHLAAGRAFRIVAQAADPRGDGRSAARPRDDAGEKLLASGKLQVSLAEDSLEKRLLEIWRQDQQTQQETGARVLFLALGFLAWSREGDDRRYRAPLILVPVTLDRKSAAHGFTLSMADDEPRFNLTLLEMLKQDYGLEINGLDESLPRDDHGLDVDGIWAAVRKATAGVDGWEVVPDVALGIFSFAKFLMWRDLADREEIVRANRVVSLLSGHVGGDDGWGDVSLVSPAEIDEKVREEDLYLPLPADSSQIAAVLAAEAGSSFVLVGPPGTGKSQTIANMIAHLLAQGRRVLFVSEKAAALDVVHRRLKAVGIGEFCLELHSAKASKTAVAARLRQALDARRTVVRPEWEREAGRLDVLKADLNAVVEAMHKPMRCGYSAFQAVSECVSGRAVPVIPMAWDDVEQHDAGDLERIEQLLDRAEALSRDLREDHTGPLRLVRHKTWSVAWQAALQSEVAGTREKLHAMRSALEGLVASLGLRAEAMAPSTMAALASALAEIEKASDSSWLTPELLKGTGKTAKQLRHLHTLKVAYARGLTATAPGVRGAETRLGAAFFARWHKARATAGLAGAFRLWRCRSQLYRALGAPVDAKEEDALVAFFEEKGALRERFEWAASRLVAAPALTRDPGAMVEQTAAAADMVEAMSALRDEDDLLWEKVLEVAPDLASGHSGQVAVRAKKFVQMWAATQAAVGELARLCGVEASELSGLGDDWLSAADTWLEGLEARSGRLRPWCAWQSVKAALGREGLGALVAHIEAHPGDAAATRKLFHVNYCRWLANVVIDRDDVLRRFTRVDHERRIEDFAELADRIALLVRDEIRARLIARMPRDEDAVRDPEWAVLKREIDKKRRHLPLREMVRRAPRVLPRIAPCMLMSPLSVAQFLPAKPGLFDIVIFDEASQIPSWDAVGALARADQVVVVGDPKQLPPTSFFDRMTDDEDPSWNDDQESVLDECLAAGMPRLLLNWHYRSRHESLIAFSNSKYYGGRLITFPSPVTDDRAVSYHHVEGGVYEMGGARTNQAEARAVVDAVVRHLKGDQRTASIGVVTFNSEQQRLIEDMLDEARRAHPDIEPYFTNEVAEPVFVKNLETVQGDERDHILFSVTYGPDHAGAVSMNFGPLNHGGGERRLNVAITRARRSLKVYATLQADQIDLTRTKAAGVRDLKDFLAYAESGPAVLSAADRGSVGGWESPFEEAVADALATRGWTVRPQIGVSEFRIDMGVVHPGKPGRYLAGVECDGATYHSSPTARDRDKVRQEILRGLGWTLVRVWSTEWWLDPEGAADRLDAALRAMLDADGPALEAPEP